MDLGKEQVSIYLHHNLKVMRKKLRISQEELALQVGLNRGNIASYEKGTAEPKICNLLRLSKFFRVSVLDLTQRDLREEESFQTANNSYEKISNGDRELLNQFQKRSEELEEVLQSLYTCNQFRAKTLSEMPKEMQILMINFEQLYEASQNLMRNHQALMEFIRCRMK